VEHNAAKQQWLSPVLVGSLIQRRIFSGYQTGYIGVYQAVLHFVTPLPLEPTQEKPTHP